MTATWASYLAAAAAALAAVVVSLVGRVAELGLLVAAPVPKETGISGAVSNSRPAATR